MDSKEVKKFVDGYLGIGEWAMDQSVAILGSSSYFERKRWRMYTSTGRMQHHTRKNAGTNELSSSSCRFLRWQLSSLSRQEQDFWNSGLFRRLWVSSGGLEDYQRICCFLISLSHKMYGSNKGEGEVMRFSSCIIPVVFQLLYPHISVWKKTQKKSTFILSLNPSNPYKKVSISNPHLSLIPKKMIKPNPPLYHKGTHKGTHKEL